MLDKLPLKALDGKKTYLTAILTIVFSISGLLVGEFEMSEAVTYLIAAFGLVGIGHKLDKSAPSKMEIVGFDDSVSQERTWYPNPPSDE